MAVPRILVADDEPFIARSLSYVLERQGYEVYVARDGQEATLMAHELKPDLIFLDVMMPGKTGYEVCREIRSAEELSHTKIVLLTAKGQPSDIEEGYAAGVDAYMSKPFSPGQVVEKVKELVQQGD